MDSVKMLEKELETLENSRKMYYDTIQSMENNDKVSEDSLNSVKAEFKKVCDKISYINEIFWRATIEDIEPVRLSDESVALEYTEKDMLPGKWFKNEQQKKYEPNKLTNEMASFFNKVNSLPILRENNFILSFNVEDIPSFAVQAVFFNNTEKTLSVTFRDVAGFFAEKWLSENGDKINSATLHYLDNFGNTLYSLTFSFLKIDNFFQNGLSYGSDKCLNTFATFTFKSKKYEQNAATN